MWAAAVRVTALKTAGKHMAKLSKMFGRCSGGNINTMPQRLFENTFKCKVQNVLTATF